MDSSNSYHPKCIGRQDNSKEPTNDPAYKRKIFNLMIESISYHIERNHPETGRSKNICTSNFFSYVVGFEYSSYIMNTVEDHKIEEISPGLEDLFSFVRHNWNVTDNQPFRAYSPEGREIIRCYAMMLAELKRRNTTVPEEWFVSLSSE